MSRAADHIPERLYEAGVHEVSDQEALELKNDAMFMADSKRGPEYMERGLRSAYRSLANQFK